MAATISRPTQLRSRLTRAGLVGLAWSVLQAAAVFWLAQRQGTWLVAAALVALINLWTLRPAVGLVGGRWALLAERIPALLIGVSVVLVIALTPRLATQLTLAGLYAGWLVWERTHASGLLNLLLAQAAGFEALFLMAAIWRTPQWLVLGLVWLAAYASVYAALTQRAERAAGVMAATWALICVQISWVLLGWLFTYTVNGGYLLVPQPALILTALAYCFGSIYMSQRRGTLSRGRLTEYLLIGLIMIAIVVIGTSWKGTI